MRDPRIVFVQSPYQNAFFVELADALIEALGTAETCAIRVTEPGAHDVGDEDVFVLLSPHEYLALEGTSFIDDPHTARRTIGISAEQPSEHYFTHNADVAGRLGAVFDFSPRAVRAYVDRGIRASHLQFGYVPSWDWYHGDEGARRVDTDVVYLGSGVERRLGVLASASGSLFDHRARLVVSDQSEPNSATSPSFLAGGDKRALLATSGILVNIHQSDEPYFEWLRFADAAHCGVTVLSENATNTEPFSDGVHFLSFRRDQLGERLDEAVADTTRCRDVAMAAYERLREVPLAEAVEPLIRAAGELLASPPPAELAPRARDQPIGRQRSGPPVAPTWPNGRTRVRRVGRFGRSRDVEITPERTSWRARPTLPPGVDLVTCVVDGLDASGRPMLEGIWSWEPWRLLHGQHLGRVMIVDRDLLDAAHRWLTEPWANAHPHVVVQLFAAVHGVRGAHVPTPVGTLHGTAVDPTHRLSDDVAERCRAILAD